MEVIRMENILKVYGKENKTIALNNVNFVVNKGDFIAIMGPSGSGKSTLLNIIGLMDAANSGIYKLNGKEVLGLSNEEMSKIRNEEISFVFQHFALMNDYTVYENVELPLTFRKIREKTKKELIMRNLKLLGVDNQVKKKPTQLSGGQQQRVAIARALVSGADIILADEPTGALDQKTGRELMELLLKINKEGKTIILVTHDKNVAKYCNRVINIVDGNISEN